MTGLLNKQGMSVKHSIYPIMPQRIRGDILDDLKDALNTGANVAMISSELNCYVSCTCSIVFQKAVVMKRLIATVLGPTPQNCPPYEPTNPTDIELSAYMSHICKELVGAAVEVDAVIDSVVCSNHDPTSYALLTKF